jgi:hypothetical protein
MSNPTRVMVMRSGAYQPLPNHLSLPWRHSWGTLLPHAGCVPLWLCGIGLGRQCFLQFLPDSQVVYSYRADNSIDPKNPHSPELCGRAPTPLVLPLQLCSFTPIVGHPLHRLPDQRMTHAQHRSPDS